MKQRLINFIRYFSVTLNHEEGREEMYLSAQTLLTVHLFWVSRKWAKDINIFFFCDL